MKSRIFAAVLAVSICPLTAAAQSASTSASPKADISSIAPPEHPCTEAQVREYFALNHALTVSRKAMVDIIHSQRALSPPYLTSGFWDDMETATGQIDLVPLVVPVYQKYISEEDLAAIIAFYKTAPGQRILAAQPLMTYRCRPQGRRAGWY